MDLENLIDSANQELYHRASLGFKIELEQNQDWRAEVWDSKVVRDSAIIMYCPSDFPKAEFAYQLLCIDMQRRGFKKVLNGLSLDSKVQGQMSTILKILNHNFQQHKLAEEFFSMGYTPQQIYGDIGAFEASFLEQQLKERGRSPITMAQLYMLLIEPFMCFSEEEKIALKIKFETYSGGKYKERYGEIDGLMNAWKNDKSYDAETYWIDYLMGLGIKDTWLSYKTDLPNVYQDEFPDGGFFVDKEFRYDEL